MNTQMKYRFVTIIVLVLLTASGCKKDKKTTTKINSDGSCVRTVVVNPVSDTSSSFPVPTDKSWEARLEGDTEKVYIASKRFDDVNQMNNEYKRAEKVGIDLKFEKKFRWFFTYFSYQETYKPCFQIQRIPIRTFLNKEEYARYENGDTSKALKERMDEFLMANIFEEFYRQLIDSVVSLHDPSLPVSISIAKKQEIDFHDIDVEKNTEDVVKYLERILGLKLKGKLERQIDGVTKSIDAKVQFMINAGGDYVNEVVMPGIVLNTNAKTVEGNKVVWHFNGDKFSLMDYTMTVESRIANPWATYATGGVLIVIVALLILPRLKRK
jgi:hypothetical protein